MGAFRRGDQRGLIGKTLPGTLAAGLLSFSAAAPAQTDGELLLVSPQAIAPPGLGQFHVALQAHHDRLEFRPLDHPWGAALCPEDPCAGAVAFRMYDLQMAHGVVTTAATVFVNENGEPWPIVPVELQAMADAILPAIVGHPLVSDESGIRLGPETDPLVFLADPHRRADDAIWLEAFFAASLGLGPEQLDRCLLRQVLTLDDAAATDLETAKFLSAIRPLAASIRDVETALNTYRLAMIRGEDIDGETLPDDASMLLLRAAIIDSLLYYDMTSPEDYDPTMHFGPITGAPLLADPATVEAVFDEVMAEHADDLDPAREYLAGLETEIWPLDWPEAVERLCRSAIVGSG